MRIFIIAFSAFLVCAGCGVKPPPDPNDPGTVGIMQPEVLQRNLQWASEMLNERVSSDEITDEQAKDYLAKYANQLIEKVDFKQMLPGQAWQYADIFRTAKRWDLAKKALEMAVEHDKKTKVQDRLVNDTLHLAEALANLGQRKEAIDLARSVFEVQDRDKAPILLSVMYEIVPALRGHGLDVETAKLLEGAIDQHNKVLVDPSTPGGKSFLAAKWHHIRKGWDLVVELYHAAGKDDLAIQAQQKAADMMNRQGRL